MKRKRITVIICAILCFCFLTACQTKKNTKRTYIYKFPNVEASLVDDTDEIVYVDYEWTVLTEKVAFTKTLLY